MYLKRLEMCGFKSFADKTRLDFEPGITGIIGPNGCGKSNTADAIRWCLGEQSARSLRSHQMLDVVFGGSQSRQTTGMAEVSLTFDNSQNMLPIDYSEVTVTRRIFRSGESEYFINKVQCRLKDIRDLFLDTGIGTEGYAIIEQGKVEFLLQAKPEERREMFEEAAGVSKYKVRREETLRKLEKVEVDMNRINDMVTLLKDQIGALDLAAKKARQYQKHKEDLKRLEITSIVHGVLGAVLEIERIKGSLDPKTAQFETQNTQVDQLEADIAQIRLEQVEKDELYVKLQDELSQIKSGINVADERVRQAANREQELVERTQSLAAELEAGDAKSHQFTEELSSVRALRQTLGEKVAELEREYKEKEDQIQAIRVKITESQQLESEVRAKMIDIASLRTNLNNEQNRLASNLTHCQAQVLSLQKELNRLTEQRTPLEAEIGTKDAERQKFAGILGGLRDRLDEIERTLAHLSQRTEENRTRFNTVKEKMVSIESRRQMLQEWEQKDPLRTVIRTVASLDIPGIKGPVSGLLRIDPGMEETVAAALGERLNYIVCETTDAAQRAIRFLEDNNLGRATFIVLDRLPDVSSAAPLGQLPGARSLISLMQYDPSLDRCMRFLCGETLIHGQSIYGRAVIQGGGKFTFEKPVLVEEQIRHLTEEYETCQKELAAADEEGRTLQNDTTRAQEEKKSLEAENQKAGVELGWLEKSLESLKEEQSYLDKELGLVRSDIETQEAEEKEIQSQQNVNLASLAGLDTDETQAKERLASAESEMQRFREEETLLTPLLTEAKVAWATHANELSSREREEQKLQESIASLAEQLAQSRNEMTVTETKIVELKQVQETETGNLTSMHQELTQKETEVQASLSVRQSLMNQLDEKNASLHIIRQETETLKQEVHNLQLEQRSFELQKQAMEQRLHDDYAASFEEVRAEYEKETFSEEEIARLKRRIESMGAVNLAAPEEYASLEERYNFLLTQQQDLLKAKEDLHQVIVKINQNTRENFKKTYDQVRENFRMLYCQLFEGGVADLTLTDESNLLECGVDIFAQPPGKKLQNIALLSGGEKALTAIALLFAFFMVKPSPFCILDEVDAPLDDANVGRYISMIKTFSEKSQFLMITHNKRTMEMADILYGVTMEELGVSKIISVRMNKEDFAETA